MSDKRDNILEPTSCWNTAQPGEPLFILKGSDPEAPSTIITWCARYIISKGGWGNMTIAQREKHNNALLIAQNMRTWRVKVYIDDDIPF